MLINSYIGVKIILFTNQKQTNKISEIDYRESIAH